MGFCFCHLGMSIPFSFEKVSRGIMSSQQLVLRSFANPKTKKKKQRVSQNSQKKHQLICAIYSATATCQPEKKKTSHKPGKIAIIRKPLKDDLVKPKKNIHRNAPIYFQSIPPNFKKAKLIESCEKVLTWRIIPGLVRG